MATRFRLALSLGSIFLWASAAAASAAAPAAADCSACHEQGKKIASSTHASVVCAQCHPKHEIYPHPPGIPKPACADCHPDVASQFTAGVHGQARQRGDESAPDCSVCHGSAHDTQRPSSLAFRQGVPETCGMCHDEVAKQYLASVHGAALRRGARDAPLCTDCHGEHSMLPHSQPQSSVSAAHIRETCAHCHGNVRLSARFGLPRDRIVSFDASYHGLAARAGSQSVANCASCHGYHNILPSSDPKSSVHPANLPATCGKCHPGAGKRFAIGPIHWTEEGQAPAGVRVVRNVYLVLIPLLIGLMAVHNLGDFARKFWRSRLKPALRGAPQRVSESSGPVGHAEIRMYGFERLQHALLLVSFFVLVWTGFALKYPDAWWARPLLIWEQRFGFRGLVHRVAGGVMIGVSILHVVSLIVNRRLRHHWLELWPRVSDVKEAWQGFAYRCGLRSKPPVTSSHTYVEKAEYWAVVWGTAVMAVTGIMLWAVNFTLAWLPKTWLDVATAIHFYEAVLATLSIVVWHLYFVIFDPDVYPADTSWLTGRSVRRREAHGNPGPSGETE